ncbi:hypothetical protein VSS37_03885 [Candidatus Thiothrix sp. Deng01]|uniref:Uncharacterized protein n=1 Tax=Candidatus Thiothrix phosphatis TaxID=3112415 RepID=A0ABU6CTF8_9GAMM|nr:hypothetical protein [Candidatus Thiothrix sp. Deng01]MEB4590112.1 hypothetical protein [Candidatus Thiothrix sp. Deng01]
MTPSDFYESLSKEERKAYAENAGTTLNYLVAHVFRASGYSRRPSNRLLVGLAMASEGKVSLDEAIDYFLVQPVKRLAAEREKESFPDRPSLSEKDGTAKKGREIKDFEVTEESARVGL